MLDTLRENEANFVAFAGTALGTIRAGKIIPWTSDNDLAVDSESK